MDAPITEGGEIFLLAEAAGGQIIAFFSYRADEIAGFFVDPQGPGVGRGARCSGELKPPRRGWSRQDQSGRKPDRRPFYEDQGYVMVREREWTTRGGLKTAVLDREKMLT